MKCEQNYCTAEHNQPQADLHLHGFLDNTVFLNGTDFLEDFHIEPKKNINQRIIFFPICIKNPVAAIEIF